MRSRFIVVFLKMLLLYAILLSSRNCTQKNFFIGRHRGQEIPLGASKNSFTMRANRWNKEAKQFTMHTIVEINKIVNIGTMHACKILKKFCPIQQCWAVIPNKFRPLLQILKRNLSMILILIASFRTSKFEYDIKRLNTSVHYENPAQLFSSHSTNSNNQWNLTIPCLFMRIWRGKCLCLDPKLIFKYPSFYFHIILCFH